MKEKLAELIKQMNAKDLVDIYLQASAIACRYACYEFTADEALEWRGIADVVPVEFDRRRLRMELMNSL